MVFVSDSIVAGEGVLETERIELPGSNPGLVMEALPSITALGTLIFCLSQSRGMQKVGAEGPLKLPGFPRRG